MLEQATKDKNPDVPQEAVVALDCAFASGIS
jgi:hypothetical protein